MNDAATTPVDPSAADPPRIGLRAVLGLLQGLALRTSLLAMPVIAVLAGYALWLRIAAHGLTGERVWATVVVAAGAAYAIGYAVVALRGFRSSSSPTFPPPRGSGWMAGLGAVNVAVAVGLVVTVAAMMTPLLSPDRLAAASQAGRLLHDAMRREAAPGQAVPGGSAAGRPRGSRSRRSR